MQLLGLCLLALSIVRDGLREGDRHVGSVDAVRERRKRNERWAQDDEARCIFSADDCDRENRQTPGESVAIFFSAIALSGLVNPALGASNHSWR